MAIFMITSKQLDPVAQQPDRVAPGPEEKAELEQHQKDILPTTGEDQKGGDKPVVKEEPSMAVTGVEPKKIDEKTIVMDGPLSQIYTQALNQMFAKDDVESQITRESYITELEAIDQVKEGEEKEKQLGDSTSYIYAVNGNFLEADGYVDAFEALRIGSEHFKNLNLCIEHDNTITPRVANIMSIGRKLGYRVFYNRTDALKALK